MAVRGDFVKRDFTDTMLNTTRLAPNVSKMLPLCFSHMFYPQYKTLFLPFLRYTAVTCAHIYIYYFTTIQTARTIELHIF